MDRQFYPHFKEFTIAVFLNKKTPAGWPNNRRIENSIDIALQRSGIGIGISDTSKAVSFKDQKGGFTVYSQGGRPGQQYQILVFLNLCGQNARTQLGQQTAKSRQGNRQRKGG